MLQFFAFIEWVPKEVKKLFLLSVFNGTTTAATSTAAAATTTTTTTKRVKRMAEELETLSSD